LYCEINGIVPGFCSAVVDLVIGLTVAPVLIKAFLGEGEGKVIVVDTDLGAVGGEVTFDSVLPKFESSLGGASDSVVL
jgi:hypothetical protein